MVEEILLDTDALIEVGKRREVFDKLKENLLLVSVISFYEFLFGEAYIGKDLDKIKGKIEEIYYVINLNQAILKKAIQIDVSLSKEGKKLPFRDIIIGTTSIVRDVPLLTKNIKHFKRLEKFGLELRSFKDL